jgi:GNAT superfamily N-acetyltransferase
MAEYANTTMKDLRNAESILSLITRRRGLAMSDISDLKFPLLTPERWADLEKLFGKHGACGGCWCMWWKLSRSEFMKNKGEENRKALKRIVDSGQVPGILAYANGEPVGWCSVAPRESFSALERSRVLRRVDDKPVWSIVCFYVAKQCRHKGLTVALSRAAINYVSERGGKMVEGYPVEPKTGRTPDPFAYTGLVSSFRKAGFVEVARRSETRPVMRYMINRNAEESADRAMKR